MRGHHSGDFSRFEQCAQALVFEGLDHRRSVPCCATRTKCPVAALKSVVVIPALPKKRSGKILRRTMRGIADGRDEVVPSTIEDASVLTAITPLLRG